MVSLESNDQHVNVPVLIFIKYGTRDLRVESEREGQGRFYIVVYITTGYIFTKFSIKSVKL